MKKSLLIVCFLCVLLSCKKDNLEPDLTLQSITLSNSNLELLLGGSATLTTTILPIHAATGTLQWSSSDSTIVKVTNGGILNAVKIGEAIITVRNASGKVSSDCKVLVSPVAVKGIVLDKTSLYLILGTKDKLSVVFDPSNTTNQKISWATTNPLVVAIDSEGNIEAVGVGDVSISASTEDGSATATCKISVGLPAITGLDIDKKNVQILSGEEVQFNAVTTPPNAQPEEMVWSSSDNTVATISALGLAKALKPGKTTIKVTNKSGLISASTELTVLPIKVQSIRLDNAVINLNKGGTFKINYILLPDNATDKQVKFSSDNASVARVDANGNVTALANGETIITLSSNDGAASSRITISVAPVKVTSIILSTDALNLVTGQSELLTASILPSNAENKGIVWKSANPTIAKVDNAGTITAISLGNTQITATALDGSGAMGTCALTVTTIDKLVKIAAKPNMLVASAGTNSSHLSAGIINNSSSPITIRFIKIYVNDVLSKTYSVNDPALASGSYIYDLGPFLLNSGALDISTVMLGWTLRFEYEQNGVSYSNTTSVKQGTFGQVNNNDLSNVKGQSNFKPVRMTIRGSGSIKQL